MKKFLLTAMAIAAACAFAPAQSITPVAAKQAPEAAEGVLRIGANPDQEPEMGAAGYNLRFCGAPSNWYTLKTAYYIKNLIYVPADYATQLAGNRITTVGFSISLEGRSTADGKVVVYEGAEMPEELMTSRNVVIRDSYTTSPYYQTSTFAEADQYVIKENTAFWFGVEFDAADIDYPICIDNKEPTLFSGYELCYVNGEYTGAIDIGSQMGHNLFLFANTVGDKTSIDNIFSVGAPTLGDFTLPIFNNSTCPGAMVYINNMGGNELTSVEYSYSFNGGEATTAKTDVKVAASSEAYVLLPLEGIPTGRGTATIKVDKVNGIPTVAEGTSSYINLGGSEGYPRKFVVEEGTGTWCGWCPRGIVGLEYLAENHPESFVGIAVHYDDVFAVPSYNGILSFFQGFPSCIVNRDPIFCFDPSADVCELAYQYWADQLSPVKVHMSVEKNDDNTVLTAYTQTEFAVDLPAGEYRIAFVLLQDGLVAKQSNNYAGGSYGACGGWEKKSSSVTWEYEHTARGIFDYNGFIISNKFKTEGVVGGKQYSYAREIAVPTFKSASLAVELDDTQLVALIIDSATGTILNATVVDGKEYGTSDGIESIQAENGPVTYYTIQGQKVSQPVSGQMYIRVQGGKATKVVM